VALTSSKGINFILYFGVVFFNTLGTISNPFLIQLITTLVNVCSTPISFYIVEKFGRRKILLAGGSFMVISQYIVGAIGVTSGKHADTESGKASVRAMIAFICLNISAFAMTWGPSAWIVVGEIFPLPIRSRGVGLSTASNWFWNCVSSIRLSYLESLLTNSLRSSLSSHPTSSAPVQATPTSAPKSSSSGYLFKGHTLRNESTLLTRCLGFPLHTGRFFHFLLRSRDEGLVLGTGG
jgi:MFS family permease